MEAFLKHGGVGGMYEALCHTVPTLVMPLGADQIENARYENTRPSPATTRGVHSGVPGHGVFPVPCRGLQTTGSTAFSAIDFAQ